MENETALATRVENHDQTDLMTISDVKFRMDAVNQLMAEVMKKGPLGDYGAIPGTGDKPTLLKPGAEKLCTLFRLAPTYAIKVTPMDRGHREYNIVCTLTHINTGKVWGQGAASASTMESKYRWRKAARKCPKCGKETIFRSKNPGEGWYCWRKKDGCGMTFAENDQTITSQHEGRTENDDIADSYNTVLKMATKRALVAAVLITTGASALFTQDIEEMNGDDLHDEQPRNIPNPQKRSQQRVTVTPVELASEDQQFELSELMEQTGTTQETAQKWLQKAGVNTFAEMPADKIHKCIELLQQKSRLDQLKQQQPAGAA